MSHLSCGCVDFCLRPVMSLSIIILAGFTTLHEEISPKRRRKNERKKKSLSNNKRGPREVPDPNNVQCKRSASGTVKAEHGNSQFYSKFGILPIYDSTDSLEKAQGASVKIKKMTRIYDGSTKFPKLEECAHFHYDFVELGPMKVSICEDNQENICRQVGPDGEHYFFVKVQSNEKQWLVRRTYENLRMFDKQLHKCIYDRKYSQLPELRRNEVKDENIPALKKLLALYLNRFSSIAGSMINCGPILSWLEMDNRGNRLIVTDDSAINTPAIAAAHVTKRYNAQAADEISFEVGDIISIIDMPPLEETNWWRGKRGFEVGFFPADCVEVIGDKVPQAMASKIPEIPPKPVLRKRGKLISFLRMFFSTRPARTQLKRSGIVKERIFGCDLGEHLLNSGHDVPLVLKYCAEIIEAHGIVDGIYRLSGVASNIQKLRQEFDEENIPDLAADEYLQDIHSISSLLKMYFRELPNPLLTYQLYDKFSVAVQYEEDQRLMKIHDVIQQLPPPHYRTAEYLIRHLARVAAYGAKTGMHCKNLAIVWAPNLLRSKELESSCNAAALQGVGLQAIVTEFLIMYADLLFSDKLPSYNNLGEIVTPRRVRPKSLAISTPTKLLSLEEARERALVSTAHSPKQKYIEVGGGPANLPSMYHTILDVPHKKKLRKDRKSPAMSGWRSLFTRNRAHSWKMDREMDDDESVGQVAPIRLSTKTEQALTEEDVAKRRRLRTVKSADSLLSATSSILEHRLSDMGDGHTIANPYADDESRSGPPSLCSTITYAGPSSDTQRPLLPVRSHSYDHTAMQAEGYTEGYIAMPNDGYMDFEEASPLEDGVFIPAGPPVHSSKDKRAVIKKAKKKHSSGSERYYKKGIMSELEDRFHRGSDSDSLTSESLASLTHSYPPPGTTAIFRSESAGPYDISTTTKFTSFGKGIEAPRSPPVPPRRVHRSRSMGPDVPGRKQSNKTSLSPTVSPTAEVPMETDFNMSPQHEAMSPTGHTEVMVNSNNSSDLKEIYVEPVSPSAARRVTQELGHPVAQPRRSKCKADSPDSLICNKHFLDKEHSPGLNFSSESTDSSLPTEEHSGTLSPHYSEAYGHVRPRLRADKQLSPLGDMLPVQLKESPGCKRKVVSLSQEYGDLEEQGLEGATCRMASADNLEEADSILRNARVHIHTDSEESDAEKTKLPIRSTFHKDVHFTRVLSDNEQEKITDDNTAHPSVSQGETPSVTNIPASYEHRSDRTDKALMKSPELSRNLSSGSETQKSLDDLGTPTEMGSIGSFTELSMSLDSLLNDIGSRRLGVTIGDKLPSPKTSPTKVPVVPPRMHSRITSEQKSTTETSASDRRLPSPLETFSCNIQSTRGQRSVSPLESCSSGVQYSSTSSVDSDIQPAEVYAESLSPTPRSDCLTSVSTLGGASSQSDILQYNVGNMQKPTNLESEIDSVVTVEGRCVGLLAEEEECDDEEDMTDGNADADIIHLWDAEPDEAKETDVDTLPPLQPPLSVTCTTNTPANTNTSPGQIEIEDVTGAAIGPVHPVSLEMHSAEDSIPKEVVCLASGKEQAEPLATPVYTPPEPVTSPLFSPGDLVASPEDLPQYPEPEPQADHIVIHKPLVHDTGSTAEVKPVATPSRQEACSPMPLTSLPPMPSLDSHVTTETDINVVSEGSVTSPSASTAILQASQESLVTMTTDEDPMSVSRSSLDELNSSKDSLDMEVTTYTNVADTVTMPVTSEGITMTSTEGIKVISVDSITKATSIDTAAMTSTDSVSMTTSTDNVTMTTSTDNVTMTTSTDNVTMPASTDSISMATSTNGVTMTISTDNVTMARSTESVSMTTSADSVSMTTSIEGVLMTTSTDSVTMSTSTESKISDKPRNTSVSSSEGVLDICNGNSKGSMSSSLSSTNDDVFSIEIKTDSPELNANVDKQKTREEKPVIVIPASTQEKKSPFRTVRKKSVKELASKFELEGSPPTDPPEKSPEIKFTPLVYHKPKIIHCKTLSPTNKESGVDFHEVAVPQESEGASLGRKREGASPRERVGDKYDLSASPEQKMNPLSVRKLSTSPSVTDRLRQFEKNMEAMKQSPEMKPDFEGKHGAADNTGKSPPKLGMRKQKWECKVSEPESRDLQSKGKPDASQSLSDGSLDCKKMLGHNTALSTKQEEGEKNQEQDEKLPTWERRKREGQSEEGKVPTNSLERRKFWEKQAEKIPDQKTAKNLENAQEKVERSESFREARERWERRTPEFNESTATDKIKDRKRLWEKSNAAPGNRQKGQVIEIENRAKMIGNREVLIQSSSESLDRIDDSSAEEEILKHSPRGPSVSSADNEESERSVRSLSQMFERQSSSSSSRGGSSEPESSESRSSSRQRDLQPQASASTSTQPPKKPWTTIL